jgi:pimeloyl-ACP methyl ester carboxylesterase
MTSKSHRGLPDLSGLCLFPPSEEDASHTGAAHCLVFCIPGNPGLISYYVPFLRALRSLLDAKQTSDTGVCFQIAGANLFGFEDADHDRFTADNAPFGLGEQIDGLSAGISKLRIDKGPRSGQPFDAVVLMGHSVGAYITLEVFRGSRPPPNLRGGVLLFPTLEHLRDSPRGRRLQTVLDMPWIGARAHVIATNFLSLCPSWALQWVVGRFLGFPPHAAEVTVRWLSSHGGVWQTLFLARDELESIREDRWEKELWEVTTQQDAGEEGVKAENAAIPSDFFLLFGKDDHWVDNGHRDSFIARRDAHARLRGEQHRRTSIVVDEGRLPHAFCIREYRLVLCVRKMWAKPLLTDRQAIVRRWLRKSPFGCKNFPDH